MNMGIKVVKRKNKCPTQDRRRTWCYSGTRASFPVPPPPLKGASWAPTTFTLGGWTGHWGSLRAPTSLLSRERAAGNCSVLAEAPPPWATLRTRKVTLGSQGAP